MNYRSKRQPPDGRQTTLDVGGTSSDLHGPLNVGGPLVRTWVLTVHVVHLHEVEGTVNNPVETLD